MSGDRTPLDRLLRREVIMRTNPLGAGRYPIGGDVEVDGRAFRVVKHHVVPTTPDATVLVYGRRV